MNKIVTVVGATASGKSQVGIEIAKKFNGEIISCDSMQVYRHMNIGTAKVTQEEMQEIPHHMIDVVNADEEYSVGEYAAKADCVINDIINKGKLPIIVGGTGLYVDGLLYPMTFGGNRDNKIRLELESQLAQYGSEHMYERLMQIDACDARKIHPNNTKRVLRALEIYLSTGVCKSDLQETTRDKKYDCLMVALDVQREVLYNRINSRVDKMFENGLLDEITQLLGEGVNFENQSMQAIGYKEFKEYFAGERSLEETIDIIKRNSRNYAKRQLTWFRKYDFAKWISPNDMNSIENAVKDFIEDEK